MTTPSTSNAENSLKLIDLSIGAGLVDMLVTLSRAILPQLQRHAQQTWR